MSRAATGAVAGFVFRLARESIPRTQAQLAEELTADLATVQGWESGRRPLANVKAGTLSDLRRRLAALGAAASVLRLLDAAMDADRLIGTALDPPGPVREHPSCGWVHTRDTAHMIAWAVNGTTPPALANCPVPPRRGPVAKAPLLGSQERDAFFTHLWEVAESAAWARGGRRPAPPPGALPHLVRSESGGVGMAGPSPSRPPRRPRGPRLDAALGRGPLDHDRSRTSRRPAAPARLHRTLDGR